MAIKHLTKSNPSFLNEDELIRYFVVRHMDFNMIMETIKENGTNSNQNIIVTGPSGTGKTMLVLRIVAAVRNDEKLASNLYPIVFGEESYEVSTAGQFWLRSIFHLGEQINSQYWRIIYRDLLNNEEEANLCDRALSSLMEFADKQGKRILLVVENLDMLFGEQISTADLRKIRNTLQNESRLMLLGTANDRFNEIDKIDEPLYGLFKVHELEPLNIEDCKVFWKAVTGQAIDYKRMRPIQILSGGNPRLLTILSSNTIGATSKEYMKNINYLVDEYTNYFKSVIESLPSIERKVFVSLAGIWEPATASQVASEARLSVSEVSALLNRLVSRGIVIPVKIKGRKKSYQVVERLYNICYLMRRSQRPSDRIQAIVRFMVHFYEGEEITLKMSSLATEAQNLETGVRKDYLYEYREMLNTINNEIDIHQIMKYTRHEYINLPEFDVNILEYIYQPKFQVEVDEKRSDFDTKRVGNDQDESIDKKNRKTQDETGEEANLGQLMYEKLEGHVGAEEAYYRVTKMYPSSHWGWANLAHLLHEKLGRYEEAEEAYRKAIEIDPTSDWTWAHYGRLLHLRLERYEEAEEAYRKAIEEDPKYDWALVHLGQLLHEKLERYEEAEEAYRKAIEINPETDWKWAQLGLLLHEKLGRYEEAEDAYRKVIEMAPKYDWVWAQLGQLLHEKLERYEEAEEAYRKVVKIDPKYDWILAQLGQLLYEKLENYEEAEETYNKIIRINPKSEWPWMHLGQLLCDKLGRYEEAEEAYRKAIKINPESDWAWAHLGQLLHEKLKRYEEAAEAYGKAVETNPKYDWAWAQLGQLLCEKLWRYEEAAEAYRKAVEINPKYDWAWAQLGQLMHEKLERYAEAEEAYRKTVEINPKYDWAWAHLGQLLHEKLERYEEAEEAYRQVVEIDPQYDWAWVKLGQLLHEKLGRYDGAEEAYRQAIEIKPKSDWAWAHLGQLLHEKLKRYEEASRAYRKAVETKPNYDWAWVKLGQLLHEKLGRYEEAEEVYRKAIEINPRYDWAWVNMGLLFHTRMNRFTEAEEAYRKAAGIDPNKIAIWVALGVLLYYELEQFEEAEKSFHQALQAEPGNTVALEWLIRVNIRLSAPHELIFEFIDRYIELEGRTDSSLNRMARLIYETIFRAGYPYAEKLAREAVEIDPDSPYYQHTLASIIGAQDRWMEALEIASSFLMSSTLAEKYPNDLVSFFSNAAIAGFTKEGLYILKDTPSEPIVEPLVVALQILIEEEYNAPKEVVEIAMDIVDEIERKKLSLKSEAVLN